MRLFKAVEIKDGESLEPVQYVGVYTLRWGKVDVPTIGFTPLEDDDPVITAVNAHEELLAALEAIADDARTDTSQPHFSDMLVDAGVLSEAADALRKWGNRPKASQDGHENGHG